MSVLLVFEYSDQKEKKVDNGFQIPLYWVSVIALQRKIF